jgi:cullin 1
MKNQALIQEVISQISQRFTPRIPDIKKVCRIIVAILIDSLSAFQSIDSLLEKDYIERVEGTRDTFSYVLIFISVEILIRAYPTSYVA